MNQAMDKFVNEICGFQNDDLGLVILPDDSIETRANFADNDFLDGLTTDLYPHTMLLGVTYRSPGRPETLYSAKFYSLDHTASNEHNWSAREDRDAQRIR